MLETDETKADWLQVRLNAASKRTLQRAADYRHKTVSEFVLSSALAEAEKVIQESEAVSLSRADWSIFPDALTNPPPPNAALRKAFAEYQNDTRGGGVIDGAAAARFNARGVT